jgi:hypothetical protein
MLNCWVSQTTTSTASTEPTNQANMMSTKQTKQSQNQTSTAGFNSQQISSASTECQTPKNKTVL